MKLTDRYPKVRIEEKDDKINIFNLWDDDSFFLRFNNKDEIEFLNNLIFPPELVAFYSTDENFIEVFAFPVPPELELVKRQFDFNFKGETFSCSFREPSQYFVKIAKGFRERKVESKTAYRNLRQFRDFYRAGELPKFISKYFEDKKPFNFIIKGPVSKIENEIIEFCKTLNFYMLYFDRETPVLQIFSKPYNKESFNLPCYTLFDSFPNAINATPIDDILLEIIAVANNSTDIRLKFIFYYQILEYASYYYLKSDIKNRLDILLRKPDISYRSSDYCKIIVEEFKNYFKNNDDKVKLDMLITEHISLNDIKIELENNIDYFSRKIIFDGGFEVEPIMSNKITGVNQLPDTTIKALKENIVNIRNCLVHLRESRENKVILPTEKNDNLILPYLYLLRRISEKIIIETE